MHLNWLESDSKYIINYKNSKSDSKDIVKTKKKQIVPLPIHQRIRKKSITVSTKILCSTTGNNYKKKRYLNTKFAY